MQGRVNHVTGWLLVIVAAALHHAVASRAAWERWQQWRNAALRAANRRHVPVPELAARLGLSAGWVRLVLNGRKPTEAEEAS